MKTRLTLLALIWLGGASPSLAQPSDAAPLPLEELGTFAEVFGKIKDEYVDPVDDVTLLHHAIQGMIAGLDPHSAFLSAEEFEDIQASTEGKFGGLGIEVTFEDDLIRVITPIDDTPAERAGIHAGDLILKLDGAAVESMSPGEAVDRMRGPPGSDIVITLSREHEHRADEVLEITLVRAIIRTISVKGEMLEPGFGYMRITSFQNATGVNVRAQFDELQEQHGGALSGLVLDLRNNPGGVLSSAVDVSDTFLDAGVIVSTRGRSIEANYTFQAELGDHTNNIPLVVLVNGGSASAAEIVAGALQDQRRAIIMGTRTFGKGSVQTIIPMQQGGALKLTTARYYTPDNRSIQARGIVPDIEVEEVGFYEDAADSWELREADLAGHLEDDTPVEDEDGTDAPIRSSKITEDYQVREALNLLKGMSLVKLRTERNGKAPG